MTSSPSLTTAPLPLAGRAGLGDRFAARPQGAPWGRATRSTGEFSNGTSGENYSGINSRPFRRERVRGRLRDRRGRDAQAEAGGKAAEEGSCRSRVLEG